MLQPNRNGNSGDYRYGFQGQEKDDEVKGSGNSVNYKYRMHDPRIARFFALDPLAPEYPHNSPYAFSENRVIDGVELEGLEWKKYLEKIKGIYNTALKLYRAYVVAKKVLSVAKDVSNEAEKYELSVKANVSLKIEAGGKGGLEIKNLAGGKGNLGAIQLVEFKGELDFRTGKLSGDIVYIGKNGEKIVSQGFSTTIPLEELGIPASVGGGVSKEETKNLTKDKIKQYKGSVEASVGSVVGATVFRSKTKDFDKNGNETKETTETGLKIGVGASGGALFYGSFDLTGIEINLKKVEED